MKIAIYCRVSTDDQTTENQKIRLVEYANTRGWTYDTFEEVESSRKTRPIKAKLLDMLRKREYEAVLVYKLDRWARSLSEIVMEMQEFNDKGIGFISYSENIDLSTAAGKLQYSLLGAFAEFEREIIRERINEGLHRARKQGKQLGRPPGSKDKKARKKGGYYLRYMTK